MRFLRTLSAFVGATFALWAVLISLLGYFSPAPFNNWASYLLPVLGLIMFGMGLTLEPSDFSEILKRPLPIILGIAAQFILMPLLAFLLIKIFSVEPAIALGLILVGCCPGGTSSNVITYLSRGDVALSVTITAFSTLLSPFVTPFLLEFYAGSIIEIPAKAMMINIAQIVLLPIIAGVVIHKLLGERLRPVFDVLPLISTSGILFILVVVVARSQPKIAEIGLMGIAFWFFLVALHNLLGYLSGYLVARACGFSQAQRRAIMIEVGMQNSGLGASLAAKFFTPETALPSVFFSLWHNVSGAILANICRLIDSRKAKN
ncbi:bile acid:sodium symporter family protein [Suttonella ornithocola]|uniref:Bile acid transporter n=1 Tax=Suttonella ornithocola TaxID=279832 RepID=A0A380MRT1_9GAMM|nr:bile acid:sodium symporter family protein [Suttonella ornithocola]SUO94998.1 bile acid transporter [Suttonella ornithocola]